jgi:hypothetical protein
MPKRNSLGSIGGQLSGDLNIKTKGHSSSIGSLQLNELTRVREQGIIEEESPSPNLSHSRNNEDNKFA